MIIANQQQPNDNKTQVVVESDKSFRCEIKSNASLAPCLSTLKFGGIRDMGIRNTGLRKRVSEVS